VKTSIISIDPDSFNDNSLDAAARAIVSGGIVAFPTETVYGIGCSAESGRAVEKLFELKKRDRSKPLTICLDSVERLWQYKPLLNETAELIINNFLPGPLTVILSCENDRILGFRIPDFRLLQRLIRLAGVPVYATSANISGDKEPTTAKEVVEAFSEGIDVLIDAGAARLGTPSTVLDLTGEKIKLVREGSLPVEDIEKLIGKKLCRESGK
jgi:L-threonylcarbamoyladenylate synthase